MQRGDQSIQRPWQEVRVPGSAKCPENVPNRHKGSKHLLIYRCCVCLAVQASFSKRNFDRSRIDIPSHGWRDRSRSGRVPCMKRKLDDKLLTATQRCGLSSGLGQPGDVGRTRRRGWPSSRVAAVFGEAERDMSASHVPEKAETTWCMRH